MISSYIQPSRENKSASNLTTRIHYQATEGTLMQPGDHRLCFVGDSFVQGTCDPECRGWVGRVAANARAKGYSVTAYNLGIRRETSRDIRARWAAECTPRLQLGSPYLFFAFGANDMTAEGATVRVPFAESIANFRTILTAAQTRYPVLVLGPLPVGDPAQDERILQLCTAYRAVAAELAIPYLPIAHHLVDNQTWLHEINDNDGSHPGAAGYDLIAAHVLAWSAWWFRE